MKRFLTSMLLFSSLSVLSHAYDTGHHSDLTRNTLEVFGYNRDAQKVGAVMNWYVDYYAYTLGYEDIIELNSMHFDNLYDLYNVSTYFTHLVLNTRNSIQHMASTGDVLGYLSVVGASLHCLQDFYTHSSWAEHHQTSCGCYRDDTWFNALYNASGNVNQMITNLQGIRTYSYGEACNEYQRNCLPGQLDHGDYCGGINKDSYVRPWFETSYGHAFAGSVEWVYNLEKWAQEFSGSTTLVDNAKNYSPSESDKKDLDEDYQSSIVVSYATKTLPGEDDGHYKGSGSGSRKRFFNSAAEFMKTRSIYKKQYTDVKFWQNLTTPNLYDQQPGENIEVSAAFQYVTPFALLPSNLNQFRKMKLRTQRVKIGDQGVGRASPYAKVNIGGLEFIEAVQVDMEDFTPHWTSIKFLPLTTTTVDIVYSLWDDKLLGSDDAIAVADTADGMIHMTFNVLTEEISGDISGVFNSTKNYVNSTKGDNTVSLFIAEQLYGGCLLTGKPEPFCPDEAYTEIKTHAVCKFEAGVDGDSAGSSIAPVAFLIAALALVFV